MQTREYGNTGRQLSIVGFAGIVVKDESAEDSTRNVSWAIDQGINYFDVAPNYGNAQNMLGPALEPYRNDVFLACKTGMRDAVSARAELEESLRLLRTDHFDLYQMHGMTTQEDLDVATGPGGALEVFVKARDEGLVRHLGFSAHSAEVAVELMGRFDFDSVLFPVNFTTWFESGFGPQIMAEAEKRGVARLALKGMAHHALEDRDDRIREKCWYAPIEDRDLMSLALRWTLTRPITAAVPPGDPELWRRTVELAQDFTPITPDEEEQLRENARGRKPLFELAHA
ncbi:MAG: aldo/keto reductase [Dehalococcoidia bacterium]|nr:aldo/keto reductase [Dehalococcoidia bacterium]